MKRILTLIALAAAVIATASCDKEGGKETPTVEFARVFYQLYSESSVDISVRLSQAAEQDVVIPLEFTCSTAVIGENYTVSGVEVTVKAGETSGSITITDVDTEYLNEITVSILEVPAGFIRGSRMTTIVTTYYIEDKIYSFDFDSADLLDRYIAKLSVEGTVSGSEFVFAEETVIPVTISGDGASLCSIEGEGAVFEAGSNTGTVTLIINDASYAGNAPVNISLNTDDEDDFIEGDISAMSITVKGVLSPATLLGTWEFDEVLDLEELELWFMEYEEDPAFLPTHNDGFTLTFSESDGNYTITPNDQGDFANYYRDATVTYTTPVNLTSDGYVLGQYTSDEAQMFVAEVDTPRQQITYFKLSQVNRAFSADTETLGAGTIAMRLRNDGKLEIYIKDCDQPPFGEMWWDGFEPDMFSFASTFTKVE